MHRKICVLVVGDHIKAKLSVVNAMLENGLRVKSCALTRIRKYISKPIYYDVVILDINTNSDGNVVALATLNSLNVHAPIIVLSKTRKIEAEIKTFIGAAQAYFVKPIMAADLAAHVRALVLKSYETASDPSGGEELHFNFDGQTATINGRLLKLSKIEHKLLQYLWGRHDKFSPTSILYKHLYHNVAESNLGIVGVVICKLRKKLHAYGAGDCIETQRGRGYRLRQRFHQDAARIGAALERTTQDAASERALIAAAALEAPPGEPADRPASYESVSDQNLAGLRTNAQEKKVAAPEALASTSGVRPRRSATSASLKLTRTERQLLKLLAHSGGAAVGSKEIRRHLYGDECDRGPKIIGVHVCKLRKKLAAANIGAVIVTVRGSGFLLRDRFGEVVA